MVKRLFVSVGIPEKTAEELLFSAENIATKLPSKVEYRLTKPDNLHFTINFLGSQEEEIVPFLKEAIHSAVQMISKSSATMILKEIDYSSPRTDMVWLYADSSWMTGFSVALARILREKGVSFDEKPFRPHMTLIRMKIPPGTLMPDIRVKVGEEISISGVDLMESTLTKTGPIYTTLYSDKVA